MLVVTTPAGIVGSEVIRQLTSSIPALPFRAAARTPIKISELYGESVPCVQFDFSDHSTWKNALADITILFLVVPVPQPRTIREHILPFIDAAVLAGCKHILYLSVPGADRQVIFPHYRVERHIEASGVPYSFIRSSYFMQNLCWSVSTHGIDIAAYHEIFIPAGKGRISFIDTRDLAAAIVKICEQPENHKNRSYLLTGSQSLNFYEVADVFTKVMDHPIRYTNPLLPYFWYRLTKRNVRSSLLIFMSLEYTFIRLGHGAFQSPELANLLGRSPLTMAHFVADNKERWLTQTWV